jgi:putative ABC transport system substrate-binding protein
MRRREFITLATSAFMAQSVGSAAQQPGRPRQIGVMLQIPGTDPEAQARVAALTQGLRELKWVEGRDFQIEYRGAGDDAASVRAAASELLAKKPGVIVTATTRIIQELQRQAPTVPLVFVNFNSPVEVGLVSSLAKPGGNITGFSGSEPSIAAKWLELLKEIVPSLERVVILMNPAAPSNQAFLQVAEAMAARLGVSITASTVRDQAEIEAALNAAALKPSTGVIAMPGGPITVHRGRLIQLANQHRIPAIYAFGYYAAEGGLMSYGGDVLDQWRRAGEYAYRILNGERPADMPVQATTKFVLSLNLRTARALGLTVSPTLLAQADELIE